MRECPQCGAELAPGAPECPSCGCGEHCSAQVDHLPLPDADARLAPLPLLIAAIVAGIAVLAAVVSPWVLLVLVPVGALALVPRRRHAG